MTPCAIKYHLLQMLEVLSLIISTCELAKFSSCSIFKMQIPLREVTCPEPTTVSSLSGKQGGGDVLRVGERVLALGWGRAQERKTRISDRLDHCHKVPRASFSHILL